MYWGWIVLGALFIAFGILFLDNYYYPTFPHSQCLDQLGCTNNPDDYLPYLGFIFTGFGLAFLFYSLWHRTATHKLGI